MKTAVEWIEELIECGANLEQIKKCLPRAKEIFEEQIKDSWEDGKYCDTIYNEVNYEDAEQYYNETFKSE